MKMHGSINDDIEVAMISWHMICDEYAINILKWLVNLRYKLNDQLLADN